MKFKDNFFFFIRFGEAEHIELLRTKGLLYMNTIQDCRDRKTGDLRSDPLEGLAESAVTGLSVNGKYVKISDPVEKKSENKIVAKFDGNIYCMVGVTREMIWNKSLNEIDLTNYYDTFLLIKNPKIFLDRVKIAAQKENLDPHFGSVKYLDPEDGKIQPSPFEKRRLYAEQYEFRIFIPGRRENEIQLMIGSIADISEKFEKNDLSKLKFSTALT